MKTTSVLRPRIGKSYLDLLHSSIKIDKSLTVTNTKKIDVWDQDVSTTLLKHWSTKHQLSLEFCPYRFFSPNKNSHKQTSQPTIEQKPPTRKHRITIRVVPTLDGDRRRDPSVRGGSDGPGLRGGPRDPASSNPFRASSRSFWIPS